MDTPFSLENYGIRQGGNVEIQDALGAHVKQKFDAAVMHKRNTGIEAHLLRNLRANKCVYQPDELAMMPAFTDVYIGLAALKARAAESWITDIILNNIDRPWTLEPTPSPDLKEKDKEEVIDMLIAELGEFQSTAALEQRAGELKEVQSQLASSRSEKANDRMENKIADQMAESDWTESFAGFIADLVAQPTALMRGPVVVSRSVGVWDGEEYKAKHVQMPTTRTISPFDAFPASDATSPQDGEYFCERFRASSGLLYSLTKVDGFNAGNIRQALSDNPNGYTLDLFGDSQRRMLEDQSPDGTISAASGNTNNYDIIILNGSIKGSMLAEHGIIVADKQDSYECEVWTLNNHVIRAILNPNPTGKRPIYATSYRKIKGSFWGMSVIDLTYDTMRICNAACRNLVRNMGYSSGPIGEVVSERVTGTQDPTDIAPYRVVLVEPDMSGSGAPAYKFHKVESVASELKQVIEYFLKIADDLSGVPSYVLGNPQVAGAGRTLGGLSMLMGNAAKGIKNVQLNIDRDVISGVVTGFYVFNMLTSDDDSIKADCKVVARGATGLLARELAQTRTVEILQLLTPYLEGWDTMPDGIKMLLREVLKTTGLPIDKIIPNPDDNKNAMDLLKMLGGGAPQGLNTGTSQEQNLPPQSMPPPQPSAGPPVPMTMAAGG